MHVRFCMCVRILFSIRVPVYTSVTIHCMSVRVYASVFYMVLHTRAYVHFLVSARHISDFKRMPKAISSAMGTITRAMCDTTPASIARDRCVCACSVTRRRSASEEK